jgi:hypothetical protein
VINIYAHEKQLELQRELLSARHGGDEPPPKRRKAIFGPLAAGAGRRLRRLGEGLESWAAPREADPRSMRRAHPR